MYSSRGCGCNNGIDVLITDLEFYALMIGTISKHPQLLTFIKVKPNHSIKASSPVYPICNNPDEDINTIVTPTAPTATYTGPITRARARQLNYHVLLFLGNDSNIHENMMLPKLDTFVLLTNEGPSLEKDEHWSKNKHGDDAMRKGNKNGVTSDDFRTLKPP